MIVDVFHDTVCPWCRIGKANLDAALARRDGPAPAVEVRYHPFFLDPSIPPEGRDFRAHMTAAKGLGSSPEALEPMFAPVRRAGAAAGLEFRFDRLRRAPNSLASHRLIALAAGPRQGATIDAIHDAYFEAGRDIGDPATLADLAAAAGLDRADIAAALAGDAHVAETIAAAESARRQGVTGVPLFVFDGAVALSGAQPPAVLLDALRRTADAAAAAGAGEVPGGP